MRLLGLTFGALPAAALSVGLVGCSPAEEFVAHSPASSPTESSVQPVNPSEDEVEDGGIAPTASAPGPILDAGPMDGATGATLLNDDGSIKGYVVAEGDVAIAICKRYNLALAQIADPATGLWLGGYPQLQIDQEITFRRATSTPSPVP